MKQVDEIQDQLRSAAEHLKLSAADILENVADAFIALDRDWRIVYANRQACTIARRNLHELLGRTYWEEWPAAADSEVERQCRRAMHNQTESHFEHHYVTEGRDLWLDIDAYPSAAGVNLFYRDVTSRKLALQGREKSENRYRQLLETTLEAALVVDSDDRITYANPRVAQLLGYDWAELENSAYFDLLFPEDEATARQRTKNHFLGLHDQYEGRLRRKDGEQVWVINSVSVIVEEGVPIGWFSMMTDITDRKLRESELIVRAETEAVINRIGQAVLRSESPAELEATALTLLGNHLNVDRCFYVLFDPSRNVARIEKDWYRPGIASLEGEWNLDAHGVKVNGMYQQRQTVVIDDVTAIAAAPETVDQFLRTGQRSFVGVPFFNHNQLVGAFTVVMADQARHWTADDIALLESAAVQLRAAVDAARARQNEFESAARQRKYMRDVLTSVTDGRLVLCDHESDMPQLFGQRLDPVALGEGMGLSDLRHAALEAASACELSGEACHDLITASGEAAMNAIVHGGGGVGLVSYDAATSTVRMRIEDHGDGITIEDLPKATLARGYSTKSSLGHGFKMILQTAGKVYLLTGPGGTIVLIEQDDTAVMAGWA